MISQAQFATILTSRSARTGFVAASGRFFSAAWVEQLEISAQIVAYKRQEAVARWFPSTVVLCFAVPSLRDAIECFYDEPVPFHGPDRRIRCGEALAAALGAATEPSWLGTVVAEVLRLETEIVRLTYNPPADTGQPGTTPPPGGGAGAAPSTSVRLASGVLVLRFPFDVLTVWERPAEMASIVASPPPHPSLDGPIAAALIRRPALQPVRVLRLGPGAADLLDACADHPETVEALLGRVRVGQREAAGKAISQAMTNGLLVRA